MLGLYLACSFAPNHKGMPILGTDDNLDYLRRQVLTSRNLRGGMFFVIVFGGLNYQSNTTCSRACRVPTCAAPDH